ncbi:survival of motor neuron-related-splicing factor 30 [Lepeophtheirus salmonis]|uniref:Survival of motor neuron-related-splicing factor 30 n=1 Tax=Lepeophtheirus salmonis TaxID=72036 RepID=C1BU79_LEPSM|nr:survival of motor neuron-related-splicing factor 30-like [Lepeophtheirus salmonis]XP_040583918.1 survival of motor neuron-related-splicing factor 30-like [Lepeophtheirus salmonis]XP_040583919.1 survival of motor neuron-related-splicing factor 30-like [Lepeophtheirus salmonis]ACO12582.1 Survival of motor neuron-related-splicing factor 30 [Lepeophtheirus salmonis]
MTEEDLNTYTLQMQQVEAALTGDPENAELLTLKSDLEQVISLTRDLIDTQRSQDVGDEKTEESPDSAPTPSVSSNIMAVKHWQVGEPCQAQSNNSYQEAVIEEISTNGEVSVKFRGTEHVVVTSLGLLKISKLGNIKNLKNRKELLAKQKEYLKKKKAKKLERLKVMEEEREQEKNKWKVFSSKAFGKKGFVKKSIFKTPENAKGRVGIGTCGVSGQNMTTFSSASKYRKGN